MKKRFANITAAVLLLILLLSTTVCYADVGYTYNYDFWDELQYSPDMYSVKATLTYLELGLGERLSNASGMFIKGNIIYVCESGRNRIIEIEFDNDLYKIRKITDSITGDTEVTEFSNPTDIFVSNDGYIYVCDKGNGRVVKLTSDYEYVMSFTQPKDDLFDSSVSFQPYKFIVDDAGRVYLVANQINKGLIKYENDGKFSGFIGATPAKYSWYDYIWKNYFMTKAQRDQTQDFVATEYDNIAVDQDGFMFVCTTHFDSGDLKTDNAKPVRKLNSLGNDILIKNGNEPPVGDLQWDDAAGYVGPSKFTDVTPLENETYFCLDETRGRIFGYDSQGHLLVVFGGSGNKDGYFRKPVAIDHMGRDLLVLDAQDGQITVFTPTDFGTMIFDALDKYNLGLYQESADIWRKVLTLDGNYELGYIGIGRALLRQGEYKEAMEYFKIKFDTDNYAKAFKLYRKQWVEEHIVALFFGFFAIILIPLGIGRIQKLKWEVAKYERDKESHNK